MRSLAVIILLFSCLSAPANGQVASKLTPRTETALASGNTNSVHRLWLYFDSTRKNLERPTLSDRSLIRRAKADPSRLLLDARDYPLTDDVISEIRSTGVVIRRQSRWFSAVSVEATARQVSELLRLSELNRIDLVNTLRLSRREEPERPARPDLSLATPDYGASATQNLFTKAARLHSFGLSGRGVLIAMLDSGFNPDHPAFDSTSIVATYDFINNQVNVDGAGCPEQSERYHQDFHGTATLGVVGGYVPDTLIGTAFGADFALAKTEITCVDSSGNDETKVEEDNWIAAAEWADSIGADIISASLGYYVFDDSGSYTQSQLDGKTANVTIAADIAASKNIFVATAAGNERGNAWGTIIFPSDGDSVLAVGACDANGNLASFSSPGPTADGRIKPDITSLGVAVYVARSLGESYRYSNGTSFSTPLVAGGAALALEHDPTMTAMELLTLIRQTGDRSGNPDNDFGYGLFDAARAADIIRIDPVEPISVAVDQTVFVPLTTSGRTNLEPQLRLANPPNGVQLNDFGDGTGQLNVTGLLENAGDALLHLVADIGAFEDTTVATLHTYLAVSGRVKAGPNPFTDSIRIFLGDSARTGSTVSIFNGAGEKVWEKVNISAFSADVITWDGCNLAGNEVAAGVYVVQVVTDRWTEHVKLLKLK